MAPQYNFNQTLMLMLEGSTPLRLIFIFPCSTCTCKRSRELRSFIKMLLSVALFLCGLRASGFGPFNSQASSPPTSQPKGTRPYRFPRRRRPYHHRRPLLASYHRNPLTNHLSRLIFLSSFFLVPSVRPSSSSVTWFFNRLSLSLQTKANSK